MLRLPDHWLWDSWIAVDGGRYHLFFLRASRALREPERRHLRASIGHAVSDDLRTWELLADALVHSDGPAFDDQALWTGSTVRGPDGRWYLFYTGVGRVGLTADQRIGLAVSADLATWHRVGTGALVDVDPRWYETRDGDRPTTDAWRDPFVFADPAGAGWHMLISAKARTGPIGGRAVLGHAWSADLLHWEVRPPLSAPAGFDQLEVPQVEVVDDEPVLVFSCRPDRTVGTWRAEPASAGTWVVPGDSLTGRWNVAAATPLRHPSLYSARLVRDPAGDWVVIGFRDREHGRFHGELLDPMPVRLTGGGLVLDAVHLDQPDNYLHPGRIRTDH